MAEGTNDRTKAYAVTVTGMITPDSDVIPLKTEGGHRMPIIANLFDDQEKAKRWAKRLLNFIKKVLEWSDENHVLGTPLVAVKEVTVPARKARAPMSEEQKRKMQQARKSGNAKK